MHSELIQGDTNNKPTLMCYMAAIAICLLPILGPYKFVGSVSIGLVFLLVVALVSIFIKRSISINKPIILLLIIHSLLSVVSFYTLKYNSGLMSMFWGIIVAFITCLSFMQILSFYEKKSFLRVLCILSIICGGFLVYQFISINLGNIPHNGKFFSELVTGYSWSSSVEYRRPNSVFSEPSYFAIYFLPILALMLLKNKYTIAIICSLLLFLSTSTLGILGSILVICIYSIIKGKYKVLILFFVIFSFLFVSIQYLNIDWLLKYNLTKISSVNQDSGIRMTGYVKYFFELPLVNQIVGVGFFQLSNYFKDYGLFNYSNAFVLVLINQGVLGIVAFISFLLWLLKKTTVEGRLFLAILVIISSIDAFIYSNNFYYILFYVLVFSNKLKSRELTE